MDLVHALTGPLGQRLTWTLLHFLWQGAILTILLASTTQLLGIQSMATRYRLSLATLVLMVVCPLATFWLVRPEQVPVDVPQLAASDSACWRRVEMMG